MIYLGVVIQRQRGNELFSRRYICHAVAGHHTQVRASSTSPLFWARDDNTLEQTWDGPAANTVIKAMKQPWQPSNWAFSLGPNKRY
jgi:hypothetical protein